MKNPLQIALLCWAIPLVLGLSIFGCWLANEDPTWMLAGLGVIGLGCLLFVVGMIALVYQWQRASRNTGPDISKRPILWTGALLLSNFPVALGMTMAAITWAGRYQISIHNNSSQPLNDIRIFGGGCDIRLDSLPPGKSSSRTFWIASDGTLLLEANTPNKTIRVQADGYVTKGLGGKTRVTFLADQTVEVENQGR